MMMGNSWRKGLGYGRKVDITVHLLQGAEAHPALKFNKIFDGIRGLTHSEPWSVNMIRFCFYASDNHTSDNKPQPYFKQ